MTLLLALTGISMTAAAAAGETAGSVASSEALMHAAEAELARAMALQLPEQLPPYAIHLEILDGSVSTSMATFGGMLSHATSPYRSARVDVRVGDYQLDNTNFNASFGERSGIISRGLPHEDTAAALRRELWLAMDSAYKGATEQLAAKLSAQEGKPPSTVPDMVRVPPLVTAPVGWTPVAGEQTRELVAALTERLSAWDSLESADAIARTWQGVRILCSSEGSRAYLPTGYTVVRVEGVVRAPDGAKVRDSRSWVAASPDALPPLEEMLAEVDALGAWLQDLAAAPVEEDYLGPVVFSPQAGVELFRQVLHPELVGTPPATEAPDGFSDAPPPAPSARLGRRLLPEGWSVVDDPSVRGYAGSYSYDFEGVLGERVVLVEDGVARDLLMSRVPRSGIEDTNGHGRSLGTDRREGMPAVVAVEPPRQRSARRLERRGLSLARQAGRDYVLVIERLEPPALAEDFRVAFSGEGPLPGITRPMEAYRLYADGRKEPVRGLEFVGVDRRTLRDVAMAGEVSDYTNLMDASSGAMRYSIGALGGLPVTWAAPAVVITEMELRGGGGAEKPILPPPPVAAADQ